MPRPTIRSVLALGSSAALAAGLLAAAVPGAGAAPVALDCTSGPVTLIETNARYELTGECSQVTVAASNVTVTMAAADDVDVRGSNNKVVATRITALDVRRGNNTVKADRVDRALLKGANHRLVAARLGRVTARASTTTVKADRARSLVLRGSNDVARLSTLRTLRINGANNLVVVKEGRTKVRVKGANNTVRVHRRA